MIDTNRRFNSPAPPQQAEASDGVLLVDKPAGPTSHDIVDDIRRRFGFRKVGHGGTLDPQATGLLIILVGRGTKLSDRFIGSDKIYHGTIRLGIATDSHDAQGKTLKEGDLQRGNPRAVGGGDGEVRRQYLPDAADGLGDKDRRRAAV